MRVNLSKTPHVVFFVIVLPLCSIGLAFLFNKWLRVESYLIESLGPITNYGFLFTWFDKHGWRLRVFQWLRIVDEPDLRGRWKGNLLSSYDGHSKPIPARLEIRQTFSTVKLAIYFEKSNSVSIIADFVRKPTDEMALHYEYQSDPSPNAEKTMNIHYGTGKLIYFADTKVLKGSYYNSGQFDRGHWGTLEFTFQGRNLVGLFDDK